MSQSLSNSGKGFTLIEVAVATFVLSVGLLSAAFLVAKMVTGSVMSKDMSTAAVLTSEKLEDLNRWDNDDPHICLPTGSPTIGSLTSDITQTTTCPGGASASVNYYDDVYPSVTNGTAVCADASDGCFAETVSSVSGTSTTYTTTVHSPNGIVQASTSTSPPSGRTFHRRWVIEGNSPATGVRRITVLITDSSEKPPMTFQMSIVRP